MKTITRMAALLLVVAILACNKHEHAEEAKAPEREALSRAGPISRWADSRTPAFLGS